MTDLTPTPIVVKKTPAIAISKSTVRTLTPVGVATLADHFMTHEASMAMVLGAATGIAMAVWGALDWLTNHTALKHLATVVDDDTAVVR